MLILKRKGDAQVDVLGCGTVTVIDGTAQNGVRLGFDFDPNLPVHRREVTEAISNELREQIPCEDKQAVIDALFAEINYEAAERHRNEALNRAAATVKEAGEFEVDLLGKRYVISPYFSGPAIVQI